MCLSASHGAWHIIRFINHSCFSIIIIFYYCMIIKKKKSSDPITRTEIEFLSNQVSEGFQLDSFDKEEKKRCDIS